MRKITHTKLNLFKKTIKNQKGQALVEFAIIIPVFLLLVFGSIDIGRIIFYEIKTENEMTVAILSLYQGKADSLIKQTIKNNLSPYIDETQLTITIMPTENLRHANSDVTITVVYPVKVYYLQFIFGANYEVKNLKTINIP